VNLCFRLGHGTGQLLRKDLAKALERLLFPVQDGIAALHQLDKLARVDVRVTAAVDIVEDFGGQLDAGDGAGGGCSKRAECGEGAC
jgi:hypothetical protein